MSLSIEIRVNGHPVAVVDAHNTGRWPGESMQEYEGRSVHFRLDGETDTASLYTFHDHPDGILILAAKLLNQAADAAKGKTK